jgi:uncharacterized protein (TIGR00255 family)
MTLSSMTGFGSAPCIMLGRRYTVNIRSVNHRFLDVKFFLPHFCEPLESDLLVLLKEKLLRGHVEVSVRLQNGHLQSVQTVSVDQGTAKDLHRSLLLLQKELHLPDPPSLQLLASFKEIFLFSEPESSPEDIKAALLRALQEAISALLVMRHKEGSSLGAELQKHLTRSKEITQELSQKTPELLQIRQQRTSLRFKALVQEFFKGSLDQETLEARAAIELASLADKADITEELARLRSHFDQLASSFTAPAPHGKKLDFLVQELNREANTIGSKSQDAELSRLVIELKTEIERIREQIQNIE